MHEAAAACRCSLELRRVFLAMRRSHWTATAPGATTVKVATGKVVSGHVVVEGAEPLEEGARVTILIPSDSGGYDLSLDDEEGLLRALEAADAQPSISANDLLQRLAHR